MRSHIRNTIINTTTKIKKSSSSCNTKRSNIINATTKSCTIHSFCTTWKHSNHSNKRYIRLSSTTLNNNNNNNNEPFYGNPRQSTSKSLSTLQTITLTTYAATKAYLNPERHDMVAILSELTGYVALTNMLSTMKNDDVGQRILNEKPIVGKDTIDLRKYGYSFNNHNNDNNNKDDIDDRNIQNTFGYHYAMFLKRNGFDPDLRAKVQYIQDEELRYVMLRYRQCHDFYHVVTDLPPTIPGELALKYVELFQTGLPVCALSATVGSWKLDEEERKKWKEVYLPWAIKVGNGKKKWMNVYWEEMFDRDIEDVRKELNIETAPKI